MKSSSSSSPLRKRVDSVSKSSNSRSRIGMTWPGTFSTTSGFSSDPDRGAAFSVGIEAGSIRILPGWKSVRLECGSNESTKRHSE